jgi:hypothetical protein
MHEMIVAAAAPTLCYLSTISIKQAHVTPLDSVRHLRGLQELKLASCTGSSPEQLSDIIGSLPNLRKLEIVSSLDKAPAALSPSPPKWYAPPGNSLSSASRTMSCRTSRRASTPP